MVAVVGGADVADVEAALRLFQIPCAQLRKLCGIAEAVSGGTGGQIISGDCLKGKGSTLCGVLVDDLHGENCGRRICADILIYSGCCDTAETCGVLRRLQPHDDTLRWGVNHDLIAVMDLGDFFCDDVAGERLRRVDIAGVIKLPAPVKGGRIHAALFCGHVRQVFHDEILHDAAAEIIGLRPEGIGGGIGTEAAAGIAEVVVVHADKVGLIRVKGSAVGEAFNDDAAAFGLIHIIGEIDAAKDGVGKVFTDG